MMPTLSTTECYLLLKGNKIEGQRIDSLLSLAKASPGKEQ